MLIFLSEILQVRSELIPILKGVFEVKISRISTLKGHFDLLSEKCPNKKSNLSMDSSWWTNLTAPFYISNHLKSPLGLAIIKVQIYPWAKKWTAFVGCFRILREWAAFVGRKRQNCKFGLLWWTFMEKTSMH